MKFVRKTFFWLHLVVGLLVGVGVAVMATTGILMAFEKPIVERAETYDGRSPKPELKAESIENLLNAAMDAVPDANPTAVTAYADLNKPAAVQFGREKILYVNNYTLKPAGSEAGGLRSFFHTTEEVHRWLATSGDWRAWGRWTTAIVNLGFLTLIVSGLWLWFPRRLRWQNFRPVLVPNVRLKGKARDWNWHNAVGFWLLIPLALIVMTGTIMSYPWANNLLFRAVGDTPPAPRGEGGPGGGRGRMAMNGQGGGERNGERGGGARRGEGGGRGENGRGGGRGPVEPINTDGLNDLWANTEDASPGWQSITLRLGGGRRGGGEGGNAGGPSNGPGPGGPGGGEGNGDGDAQRGGVSLAVNYANPLSPLQRVTFNYNRRTGELISKQTFADVPAGRRARSLVLPIHRGEILGLPGMAIAAVSSLAALVLVYTGFALSWRRLVRPVLAKVRNRRAVHAEARTTPTPAGTDHPVRSGHTGAGVTGA